MKNRKRKMRLLEERIALAEKKAEERKAAKVAESQKKSKECHEATSPVKTMETEPSSSSTESQTSRKRKKNGRIGEGPDKKKRREEGKSRPDKSEIWFDGVDPALIAASRRDQSRTYSLFKPNSFSGPTRHVAIDCEFVGVGYQGKDSVLARVSVVNQFGHVLIDKFVQPKEKVTDYRTKFSGVRPKDLVDAETFETVHAEVAKLLDGRVVVGHALRNDLKVLFLSHPRHLIRDTSRYRPFRQLVNNRTPSLKRLTHTVLGVTIQEGEHDSVTDARAAMCLFLSRKVEWEASLKHGKKK